MTKPYKYQKRGVRQISVFGGRALLADEMGLGKTFQALLWAKMNLCDPVVVVCPANLKWNWEREIARHLNWQAEVLEGQKVPHRRLLHPHRIIIVNYDILPFWKEWLMSLNPELILIDECQYIKSMETKRTKATQLLCQKPEYIIAMSGTPMVNRPIELFPILNILQPEIFPSRIQFGFRYCKPKTVRGKIEFKGAANLPELNELLCDTVMIRRLKKDVLPDLPKQTRAVVPITITDPKQYRRALVDFRGWLKSKSMHKAYRATRAEAFVKIGYLKRLASELKMPAVLEWIQTTLEDTDGKLVVFCVHKFVIRALQKRFGSLGVTIDGSTPKGQRRKIVDQFQNDKRTKLLFGNIQAAGTGLNLTAASRGAVIELGWTPGEHSQVEARLHRIGQKLPVEWYYLVGKGTIEERICELIQEKQQVLNTTLDGDKEVDAMDLFDILLKELHRELKNL